MRYRWNLAPPQPLLVERIAATTGVSRLMAQCLLNRGLTEPAAIKRFLDPRLKDLADPFLLPDMAAAADRLFRALREAEPLVIFGDYDADGVTSCAQLFEFLSLRGWRVSWYLPHRMDEGYGLSREGVANCLEQFPAPLLLAVDCGSTAVATIAWLRERKVEVIVLDHHQMESQVPAAVALVNPHRVPDGPGAELCSAGLAFKLIHALTKRGRELGLPGFANYDIRPFLDLAAVGTVADLAPLIGENRILVSAGLERLNKTSRCGFQALRQAAGIAGEIGAFEVGFQIAPRLNAAGRMENASAALRLLLAPTHAEAAPLAKNLDAQNRERQAVEKKIAADLAARLRQTFKPEEDFVIVEADPDWHLGVVGIVAARILAEFHRPTIILGGDAECWRGSGRSIEGFDLAAALRECDSLLERHGGHSMAAGVTLRRERLDDLRGRLNEIARRRLQPEQLQPQLRLDAETPLAEVTLPRLKELEQLQPFGQQNPCVHLKVTGLTNACAPRRLGTEQQHLKLRVTDGRHTLDALWWGAAHLSWPTGRFSLAAVPQINEYNGTLNPQLRVLDWQPE